MSNRAFASRLAVGCLLLLLLDAARVWSQDRPASAEVGADSVAPAQVEGPPERIIYIPFDRFSDVYAQPDASVVLRYAEYLELLAVKAQAANAGQKPADAVITRAAYTATIEQDLARIQAALTVNVIGKPWVEVPLSFGEAAVGEVTSEDGEILLRGTGEGTYALLFKKQGEQLVRLDLTARVVTSPEGRQIYLDCPPAAITTFEIAIPQPDQEVEIRPRLLQQPAATGADETRVRASLGATGHIAAAWRPRATAKPSMQLLASVTSRQRHHLADGLIHADAWLTYAVLRGELQKVRIVVPPGHRVLDVAASTKVQGWQTEESDERQVLTIELLNAVADEVTVEVHTEQKLVETTVRIGGYESAGVAAGIHALDVVRESGQIVVSRGDDLSLRVTEQVGVVRIEPEQVAQEVRQAGALAYKFYNPAFTLAVAVSDLEPRVSADHQVGLVIGRDEIAVRSTVSYTIDRAGVFELRVEVPEGLIVDDVRSEHLQEFRVVDETLIAVLRERTLGKVALTIEAHLPLDEAAAELTLPVPEPLDVERETGLVQLFSDDSVELTTNEDALEAARPAPAPPQQGRGGVPLRAAWQFTRRPVVIPVIITRKPVRLSASVATDIRVEPTRTRVTTLIDFNIEYAGLDRFRVSIPEEARETLQIEAIAMTPASPALKESPAGDPADGWIPYTLVMQRDVIGQQRFRIIYDLEPAAVVVPGAVEADAEASPDGDERADDVESTPNDAQPDTPGADGGDGRSATPPDNGDPAADDGNAERTSDSEPENSAEPPATDEAEVPVASTPAGDEANANRDADTATDAPPAEDAAGDVDAEESPAALAEVNRMQTAIRIIRPLESASADGTDATSGSRVTGEVRIQHDQSLTITADAAGADVEPVDVRELRTMPTDGTFAFRYRKHPPEETIRVTVTQARYGVQDVIATVVSRALVEVVLSEDLTATYRCRYRLKSTERQRLRVDLPKGLEVLSVLVDGSEVRLEPNPGVAAGELSDSYFVKVARTTASDEAFSMTFQYLWTVNPEPFERGLQGTVRLPLPRIGEPAASAVQQTRVVVWVPDQYALVGDPPGFTLESPTLLSRVLWGRSVVSDPAVGDDAWIGGVENILLEFPTTGRTAFRYSYLGGGLESDPTITVLWWNTLWYEVVVSMALAAIGWVLLRTSWENKLGVLLLLAFAGVLLGLKSEQVLAQALSAARFGLLFLLGLWLVGALFGRRHRGESTSRAETLLSRNVTSTVPPHVAVVPPPGVFEQHQSGGSSDHDHP